MINYVKTKRQGEIIIYKQAFCDVIISAISKYKDKVFLVDKKGKLGGITSKFRNSDNVENIEFHVEKGKIFVKFYVVIKFGTSISSVSDELISLIHEGFLRITGVDNFDITMSIVGVMSKNISKRDIEVNRVYEP